MARLPSEQYLMQQIGARVILFEDFTEREIARFDPADGNAAAVRPGQVPPGGRARIIIVLTQVKPMPYAGSTGSQPKGQAHARHR